MEEKSNIAGYEQGLCRSHGLPLHPQTKLCPMCVALNKEMKKK
jgi:hypothetical protein